MEKVKDTIYRQDAIDAICNACGKIDCDKMDKCEKLQLPPANCSEFPNNSDTISRQAAIDAIKNTYGLSYIEDGFNRQDAVSILENLPSAQPERKTGKWIDGKRMKFDGTFYWFRQCDQCGYERNDCDTEKDSNFCPDCGAKMEGEQDGER